MDKPVDHKELRSVFHFSSLADACGVHKPTKSNIQKYVMKHLQRSESKEGGPNHTDLHQL